MKITKIIGREVLDSRGNPTVEADVHLENGHFGRATVPSGASVGAHEAHELRDGDTKRYGGLGVTKAVANINQVIAHDLIGLDVEDQRMLDQRLTALDGTANKSHLGANAILAVSIACLKVAADMRDQPIYSYIGGGEATTLPMPLMNIINGGRHAADSVEFQELMIVPMGAETFHQALQMGLEVYYSLKDLIKAKNLSTTVGDEGGFGLPNTSNEDALQLLTEAIEKANYHAGTDIQIALDIAADEFFSNGQYVMTREKKTFTPEQMRGYVSDLMGRYPIYSVEDPLAQDDWAGYAEFTAEHGHGKQIVGDDLYATNITRLQKGVADRATNAVLVKLNQIGTVTETIDVVKYASQNRLATIISHRSGDTVDPFIADFCVGLSCGQIKTGAPARSERTAKYNQLLRIEEWLGPKAKFSSLV